MLYTMFAAAGPILIVYFQIQDWIEGRKNLMIHSKNFHDLLSCYHLPIETGH